MYLEISQTGVLRGMSAGVKSCSALLTLLRILVFPNSVGNYQRVLSGALKQSKYFW